MSDEVTLASRYHVTQFSNHSFCFTSLVSNGIPYGRYFSSLGLLNNVGSIYKKYNIDGKHGPMGLVFGGDGGLLHNSYPDRYGFMPNSFFDDVWLLSPGGISVSNSMNQWQQDHFCEWSRIPGSTALQIWSSTCGWVDDASDGYPGECSLKSILIAAWCRGQYQSFYMS